MPGRGPAPKQPEQRRNGHAPQRGEWVDVAADARIDGDPPDLPVRNDDRSWRAETLEWWTRLWSKPIATMWDRDDSELPRLAFLHQKFWSGDATAAETTEMRQIEDRHGLNPKGMRDLRWRIVDAAADTEEATGTTGRKVDTQQRARRSRALKLVEGG